MPTFFVILRGLFEVYMRLVQNRGYIIYASEKIYFLGKCIRKAKHSFFLFFFLLKDKHSFDIMLKTKRYSYSTMIKYTQKH